MPNDKEHHIVERLAEESITEVLVGYRSYTLNIKRGLKEANEKCFGSADFDKGIISLEKDMDHETARKLWFMSLLTLSLSFVVWGAMRKQVLSQLILMRR